MSRRSHQLYAALLRLYPTDFHRRWGADMRDDFAELLEESAGSAPWGRLQLWTTVLADLAASAPRQHVARIFHTGSPAQLSPRLTYSKGSFSMGSLFLDLRHTLRSLRKSPVYALVTVLVLAVGIGANAAIFSLVQAVVLKPLPFDAPERLVWLTESIPEANMPMFPFNAPDLVDFTSLNQSFDEVASFQSRDYELSGNGSPETVLGTRVSFNLFPTLGIQPAIGRGFTSEEDIPQAGVAMISFNLWQSRFGGRPDVLGETIDLDRQPHQIVGVLPASGIFPLNRMPLHGRPAEIFLPMGFTSRELESRGMMHNLGVLGRTAPGVEFAQAQGEMDGMGARIQELYGDPGPRRFQLQVLPTPLRDAVVGQVEKPLLLLLGAMALVLLVACANVANLALSRSAAKRDELGIRAALGAGRARILQLQLLESGILSLVGGTLGVLLGAFSLKAALQLLPTAVPFADRAELDFGVVGFSMLLVLGAIVSSSLAPLVFGGRLEKSVNGSRSTGSRSQQRWQQAMVVVTVGLAVVLLVGAGLLLQSFQRLVGDDRGYAADSVLTMEIALPTSAYGDPEQVRGFAWRLEEQMQALAGVTSAAVTTALPSETTERRGFAPDDPLDPEARMSVAVTWASSGFFETLGIPLRQGRAFRLADTSDAAGVVVVSTELARRTWGTEDVIGKRLRWSGDPDAWAEVVGVVGEVIDGPLGSEPTPHLYVPYDQFSTGELNMGRELGNPWGRSYRIALATDMSFPTRLTGAALDAIGELDGSLAVTAIGTLDQRVGAGAAPRRFSATLLFGFAMAALLLAAIGIYGVLAYRVVNRKREIGLRLALGAERREVVGLIVGQGLRLTLTGLLAGLLAAFAVTRLMTSVLYNTKATDPMTWVGVSVVLLGAAALASWLPAHRAGRIDPVSTLRSE